MDANGNATHALFTGEAMMVSPARSTASTVIPPRSSTLRPVTIKQLYDGFLQDIERYPILIEGEPVSSAKLKPAASTVFPKRPAITPTEVPMELSTKDKIFTILRDPAYRDIAHGVSLKLIRSALDISQDEIMKVISEQIYLGLIYTTVDDNHFKSSI
ncbi:uncharacterized protein LOC123441289 [Hordeum vulgare subsp. vulgare]|uniref:uncharacterized protein LOC123441289 n=1 Tax=Hordeum vulgare subsp. vulgare TaxID=112509 RepID=UPI001D1A361B|nr:uncharacterized protein LOC123441289 [Hordeum vulgare subsp. vulgare]